MQLNQQKIALLAIKDRMQRDYNMICARYTKLFNGLNSNLKLRVLELDRPSMDLALKENEKSSNRVKYLAASTTISQLESIKLGQTILGSNIKNKGFKVLNSMKTFLSDMILQKRRTESILINDNQPCNRSYFLPALLVETQIANQYGLHNDIYINSNLLSQSQQDLIRNNIRSKFQDGQWSKTDSINPELDKQFRNLCSDSRSNERIRKMALNLYESNLFYKI
jgi:hypothetical protein